MKKNPIKLIESLVKTQLSEAVNKQMIDQFLGEYGKRTFASSIESAAAEISEYLRKKYGV